MALKRVERGRAYFKSGLVATASGFDLNSVSGDELGDGTEGSNFQSIGNEKNDATLELIVPVDASGENHTFDTAMANHETFTITFYLGGKFFELDAFCESIGTKSQSSNGMLTATVKVKAGAMKRL
jgi:hypothetical protein